MSQPQVDPPAPATPATDGPNPNSKSAGEHLWSCGIALQIAEYVIFGSAAKKEAKRLEKEAKLAAKVAKVAASTPAAEKKAKAEKKKEEEEAPFVNTTPKGEKKGESLRWS